MSENHIFNEDDLVSIIIPVFNVAEYFDEAIRSVIHQTYSNLEIILVDDGSFDGSEEYCDKYAFMDPRIHVIHQKNQGLSAARNSGLDYMSGSYVAFLDSDDAYAEDYIENLHSASITENADIVVCRYAFQNTIERLGEYENSTVEPKLAEGLYTNSQALRSLAQFSLTSAVWNKLYKADLWKSIRFPIGRLHEDIDTLYRVFNLCNSVFVLDKILYYYRKHKGTISNSYNRKHIEDYIYATSNFISFIQTNIGSIFTIEDLYIRSGSQFERMLIYYISYVKEKDNSDPVFLKQLRGKILTCSKIIRFKDINYRMRSAYRLIKYCPFMMKLLCNMYFGLKSKQLTD